MVQWSLRCPMSPSLQPTGGQWALEGGGGTHTLKYTGSTLCLRAWALPTRASTEDTFSGSCRFSTTELRAPMTRQACFRSCGLRSISSGSSMC